MTNPYYKLGKGLILPGAILTVLGIVFVIWSDSAPRYLWPPAWTLSFAIEALGPAIILISMGILVGGYIAARKSS